MGQEKYEAADIRVEGCEFVGSTSPIAFVGVDGAQVKYCTFVKPEKWLFRILQETTVAGFVPSRRGVFSRNLILFESAHWSAGGVNIGPNTDPESFTFDSNYWYCLDAPAQTRASLPRPELRGVYGVDPQVRPDAEGRLRVTLESPAFGYGISGWSPSRLQ
jgi:hypothetical protein